MVDIELEWMGTHLAECYGLVSCYSTYVLSQTITYLEHLYNLVVLSLVVHTVLSISIVQALLCVTSKIDSQM